MGWGSNIRDLFDMASDVVEAGLESAVSQLGRDLGGEVKSRGVGLAKDALHNLTNLPGGDPDASVDPGTGWPLWFLRMMQAKMASIFVLGRRGSGKSALVLAIGEYRNKPVYVLDAPDAWVRQGGVKNIESIHDAKEIPAGATFIIDDATRYISARTPMAKANRKFIEVINTVRHRDVFMLINAPTARSVEVMAMEATAFFVKEPEAMWPAIERPELRSIYEGAESGFASLPESDWKSYAWVWSNSSRQGLLHFAQPEWYGEAVSKFRVG